MEALLGSGLLLVRQWGDAMSIFRLAQLAASGLDRVPEGAWDLSYAYPDNPNPWVLTNAHYFNSFLVSGQDSAPTGMHISRDGTKLYMIGRTTDAVYQYSLTRGAWDIDTPTYTAMRYVNSENTFPTDIFFSEDGTKMYICGIGSGIEVNEYALSVAWSVTSANFVSVLDVSAQGADPEGLFFRADGRKMYTVCASSDSVHEYDLSIAWDLSTASHLQSRHIGTQETNPRGLSFKSDGTIMYVIGSTGDDVNVYNLSTPWDVTTASYSYVFSVAGSPAASTSPASMFFDPTGSNLYVLDDVADAIYRFGVGGFDISSIETTVGGIFITPNGTALFIVGTTNDTVYKYALSTPWDIMTASFSQSFSVSTYEASPTGIFFKPDGTKMFIIGSSGDEVNQFSLSPAWDISSPSFGGFKSVSAQDTAPQGVHFSPDGTVMFMVGQATGRIQQYGLSTPWNVTTASSIRSFSLTTWTSNPNDLWFKDDGTAFYVLAGEGEIFQFDMPNPWTLVGASYSGVSISLSPVVAPYGLCFKSDGTKCFYAHGASVDKIFSHSIGVQP